MGTIEAEMSFHELATILGIDDYETPCEYDLTDVGIMVESPDGFKQVFDFVVKPAVDTTYLLGNLKGTSQHRTLLNGEWVKLGDNPEAIPISKRMNVVDISVPDGNAYIANGHVNHNTTPGGELLASLAGV
jgi:hypothetical protein